MRVEPYSDARRDAWQRFAAAAKNGVFLFDRDYMDYHADRFTDASLLCYDDDTLVALFPASVAGDVVCSHAGLTYGGVVSDSRMKTAKMLALFDAALAHWRRQGIATLLYKPVPHIYHLLPAEEDLYALFRADAALVGRSVASVAMSAVEGRPAYSKGRKACIKTGRQGGINISECNTPTAVMRLLTKWLPQRHQTSPVHTVEEMQMLMQRFPKNIRAFAATDAAGSDGDEPLAGVIVYEAARAAHCQYIVASDEGRERCAPDMLMAYILEQVYADKPYFDWGTSNADNGRVLAESLALNKESFGGRAVCYDCYQVTLS